MIARYIYGAYMIALLGNHEIIDPLGHSVLRRRHKAHIIRYAEPTDLPKPEIATSTNQHKRPNWQ